MTYVRQSTDWTCGPAALSTALARVGVHAPYQQLRETLGTNPKFGTSTRALVREVRRHGLRARVWRGGSLDDVAAMLAEGKTLLTCYWIPEDQTGHYALFSSVTEARVTLVDPWYGPAHAIPRATFLRRWHGTRQLKRWVLILGG